MTDSKAIRTVREVVVFENEYVRVYNDEVAFPSGVEGHYFRYRWTAPHGVAVVMRRGADILLLRKFRYSERAMSLEIPQGFGLDGAMPADDARRELLEETGLEPFNMRPLLLTGVDFKTHVFVADQAPGAEPTSRAIEQTEAVEAFVYLPLAELDVAGMAAHGITDVLSMAAILALR
jgi:ADP-ribose pyrophosphatase YjhB (NUDIX family)